MPVRNEAGHLARSVAAVLAQGYPGEMEVRLAVAPSRDGTESVAAELAADERVSVEANPTGVTSAGLNAVIASTSGDVVARVDGHSELSPGYLERAVRTLDRTGAVNVGGVQRAIGRTAFERAVAVAMTSPFGVGDAKFHYGGTEGPSDTVYLGVFRREALEAVGGFDESLVRNQDYELNWRLREAGGVVWFDPALWVAYRPRPSLPALARQYYGYGRWKAEVLRRHPRSVRWRHLVAPAATFAIVFGLVVGPRRRFGLTAPGSYGVAVVAAALRTGTGAGQRIRLATIYPTMHLTWGTGFLAGVAQIALTRIGQLSRAVRHRSTVSQPPTST